MALVKNTNSYVTVNEADAYFETRMDVAAWNTAKDDDKESALVTATSMLDDLNWVGVVESDSQSLAFPRTGSYFDPRKGYEVDFSGVPSRIVRATCEMAYHLLNNDGLLDNTGSVFDLQVGSIKLNKIRSPHDIPSHVDRIINPMLVNRGANLWWRAN